MRILNERMAKDISIFKTFLGIKEIPNLGLYSWNYEPKS